MGQDRQGCSVAVVFLSSDEAFLSLGMIPQEEDGRFGARPRAMRLANCCPGGSRAFAGRCLGTRDETTIGSELLDPRDAVDVGDFVPQHEPEDLAEAGHRTQQIQGVGVMVLGRVAEESSASRSRGS